MPAKTRCQTKHPGVYYIETNGGREKVFYVYYRRGGKQIEEKAGGQYADDMTEAKAAGIRADRMRGKSLPNRVRRREAKAAKEQEENTGTLTKLWKEYEKQKPDTKAIATDRGRFEKHIKPTLGDKEPHEIIRLEVDRLRVSLQEIQTPNSQARPWAPQANRSFRGQTWPLPGADLSH